MHVKSRLRLLRLALIFGVYRYDTHDKMAFAAADKMAFAATLA